MRPFRIFATFATAAAAVAVAAAAGPMLERQAQALRTLEELRASTTLTELERHQVAVAEQYLTDKIANAGRTAEALAAAVAPRTAGLYTDGSLTQSGNVYTERSILAVDVNTYLTGVLSSNCASLDVACEAVVAELVADLVPAMYLIASREASVDTVGATATTDLLAFLYSFPPASDIVVVLETLFGNIGLAPTSAVTYHTANAAYTQTSAISGNLDLASNWFGAYQSYEAIIEYDDSNRNGHFDSGEALQTYNLGTRAWNSQALQTHTTSGGGRVFVASSATTDNVVTITCTTASSVIIDPSLQLLTPNATKCSVVISNFPFSHAGSYLALKTHIALANVQFVGGVAAVVTSLSVAKDGQPAGYIDWVQTATSSSGHAISVVATATGGVTGPNNLVATFIAAATGTVTSQATARTVYYSFVSAPSPSYINWDPSIGYGDSPNSSAATMFATTSFVLSVLIATVLAVFTLA